MKTWPGKFAAIGLLVGYRLYPPSDRENPARLERLVKEDRLVGLRFSLIRDPQVRWLDDPVSHPLWKKAEELGCTFNIFLLPIRWVRWLTWRSAFRASTLLSITWR